MQKSVRSRQEACMFPSNIDHGGVKYISRVDTSVDSNTCTAEYAVNGYVGSAVDTVTIPTDFTYRYEYQQGGPTDLYFANVNVKVTAVKSFITSKVKRLVLPNTITTIYDKALQTSITGGGIERVNLPSSITSLGNRIFTDNVESFSLKRIDLDVLPSNITFATDTQTFAFSGLTPESRNGSAVYVVCTNKATFDAWFKLHETNALFTDGARSFGRFQAALTYEQDVDFKYLDGSVTGTNKVKKLMHFDTGFEEINGIYTRTSTPKLPAAPGGYYWTFGIGDRSQYVTDVASTTMFAVKEELDLTNDWTTKTYDGSNKTINFKLNRPTSSFLDNVTYQVGHGDAWLSSGLIIDKTVAPNGDSKSSFNVKNVADSGTYKYRLKYTYDSRPTILCEQGYCGGLSMGFAEPERTMPSNDADYKAGLGVDIVVNIEPATAIVNPTVDQTSFEFTGTNTLPDIKLASTDTAGVISWDANQTIEKGTKDYSYTYAPNNAYANGIKGNNIANYTNPEVKGTIQLTYVGKNTDVVATFNPNGGVVVGNSTITKDEDVALGTLPSATKDGAKFIGWYDAINGGNLISETSLMPADNVTYFAHWEAKNYTVNYNLDAAGLTLAPKTDVKWSDKVNVEAASVPKRKGYTFTGWTYNDVTDKPVTETTSYADIAKTDTTTSITLKAIWSANTYTVEFKDGSTVLQTSRVPWEQEVTFPAILQKEGYSFAGFKVVESSKEFGVDTISKKFSELVDQDIYDSIVINVVWEEKADYVVNYDYNTTVDTSTLPTLLADVKWTQTSLLPQSVPSVSGLHIEKWILIDTENEVTTSMEYNELVENDTVSEVTLQAVWAHTKYTITYNLDGGVGVHSKADIKWNDDNLLPASNEVSKGGYTLDHWVDAQDNQIDNTTTYSLLVADDTVSTTTLKAIWTARDYTLTYEDNGVIVDEKVDVKWDDVITLDTLTKQGYVFDGWLIKDTETEVVAGEKYSDLVLDGNQASLVLTVKWIEKDNYKVVYNPDNGEAEYSVEDIRWSQSGLVSNRPSKAGYTFDGWLNVATGLIVRNTSSYGSLVDDDTVVEVQLKAKWSEIPPPPAPVPTPTPTIKPTIRPNVSPTIEPSATPSTEPTIKPSKPGDKTDVVENPEDGVKVETVNKDKVFDVDSEVIVVDSTSAKKEEVSKDLNEVVSVLDVYIKENGVIVDKEIDSKIKVYLDAKDYQDYNDLKVWQKSKSNNYQELEYEIKDGMIIFECDALDTYVLTGTKIQGGMFVCIWWMLLAIVLAIGGVLYYIYKRRSTSKA